MMSASKLLFEALRHPATKVLGIVIAIAGLTCGVMLIGDLLSYDDIKLEYSCKIPASVPEQRMGYDKKGDETGLYDARTAYEHHFCVGWRTCFKDHLDPRRRMMRNNLKAIDGYAAQAERDGEDECLRQIKMLIDKHGRSRVLRVIRWKYGTEFDQIKSSFERSKAGSAEHLRETSPS